jgi:hypothetical protein
MRSGLCLRQASRSEVVESGPPKSSHMQVPHADLAGTVYMYRYLGARLLWYRAASAADLDLAMPVIGLFGAGAQGSRNGGKGVTERAQFPGSVRGCRAARAGKGG